jgi:hypothetical protein
VGKDEDELGWAPLRDTYMLGSKLKDWDKMQVMSSDLLSCISRTKWSFVQVQIHCLWLDLTVVCYVV